jgi:hypothetical protein
MFNGKANHELVHVTIITGFQFFRKEKEGEDMGVKVKEKIPGSGREGQNINFHS